LEPDAAHTPLGVMRFQRARWRTHAAKCPVSQSARAGSMEIRGRFAWPFDFAQGKLSGRTSAYADG